MIASKYLNQQTRPHSSIYLSAKRIPFQKLWRQHLKKFERIKLILDDSCNKYQMSDYLLKCSKCKAVNEVVYYCCLQDRNLCYNCAKVPYEYCTLCGKKKTKPLSHSKIGNLPNKPINEFECRFCKKRFEKINNFIQFDCNHASCFKCLSKKIQDSIKSGSWERKYNQNPSKKCVECNCGKWSSLDITKWMEEYCFCCGDKFFQSHKVKLKYGLVIREYCRNRLLYDNEKRQPLTSEDINCLSNECKSCSQLIDGYRRTVGLEDTFGCECRDCLNGELNNMRKMNINNADKKSECIICSSRQSQSSMVLMDNFYLCQHCYNVSKRNQADRKQSPPKQEPDSPYSIKQRQKMEEQKKKNKIVIQIQCWICQSKIANPVANQSICQKCMRDNYDSPLVRQLERSIKKEQNQINKPFQQKNNAIKQQQLEEDDEKKKKNLSPFKKSKIGNESQPNDLKRNKSNPDGKTELKCISCNRYLQPQSVKNENNFSEILCHWCIEENEKGIVDFKRNTSQSTSSARIRNNKNQTFYRSAQEHSRWRKGISYQSFLKESEDPNIRNLPNQQQRAPSAIRSRVSSENGGREIRRGQKVIESIIQEFPDVDTLDVAVYKQSMTSCSICRCILPRNNMLSYKTVLQNSMNLCLHCYILCQAKNL